MIEKTIYYVTLSLCGAACVTLVAAPSIELSDVHWAWLANIASLFGAAMGTGYIAGYARGKGWH